MFFSLDLDDHWSTFLKILDVFYYIIIESENIVHIYNNWRQTIRVNV